MWTDRVFSIAAFYYPIPVQTMAGFLLPELQVWPVLTDSRCAGVSGDAA